MVHSVIWIRLHISQFGLNSISIMILNFIESQVRDYCQVLKRGIYVTRR